MNIAVLDNLKKVNSIHLLRGIAIIFIVLSHCYSILWSSGMTENMGSEQSYFYFFSSLTVNWTVAFVLIAGFLFQHLSYKFNLKKYYLSKIKNVIVPYTIISLVFFSVLHWDSFNNYSIYELLCKFLYQWKKGGLSVPFWFIPMMTIIYVLSPLFKFLSDKKLIVLSLISFLWVTLYPRPLDCLKTISVFFHFFPIYIIGMAIRKNYNSLITFIHKNVFVIVLVFCCTLFFIATLYETVPNFTYRGVLYTPLKIIIFILFLYFLDFTNTIVIKNKINVFLSYIADISFPIFFIHYVIIECFFGLILKNNYYFQLLISNCSGYLELFIGIVIAIIVIFISAILVEIVRIIAKGKSRYFIGG